MNFHKFNCKMLITQFYWQFYPKKITCQRKGESLEWKTSEVGSQTSPYVQPPCSGRREARPQAWTALAHGQSRSGTATSWPAQTRGALTTSSHTGVCWDLRDPPCGRLWNNGEPAALSGPTDATQDSQSPGPLHGPPSTCTLLSSITQGV